MAFSGKTQESELGTLHVFKAGMLKEGFSGFSSQVGFGELPFDSTDNFNSCPDVCFRVEDYNFLCHKVCACAVLPSPPFLSWIQSTCVSYSSMLYTLCRSKIDSAGKLHLKHLAKHQSLPFLQRYGDKFINSTTAFTAAESAAAAGLCVQCLERGMFDLQANSSKNEF